MPKSSRDHHAADGSGFGLGRAKASSPQALPDTKPLSPRQRWVARFATLLLLGLPLLGSLAGIALAWQNGLSTTAILLLFGFYVLSVLGSVVGNHRLFTHRSFEPNKPLKVFLIIASSLSLQGPVLKWVADHRRHHLLSDGPGDPHSPHLNTQRRLGKLRAFWHAHIGWAFVHRERTTIRKYAPDLLGDEMLIRLSRHYVLWSIVSLSLPAALAFAFTRTAYGALEGLLWGGFVRVFLTQHATFALNSFAHVFGTRRFDTAEGSRNNWVLGIVLVGEGWHNNHHAFPSSAVTGLHWWEVDPCGWLILLFERLNWAKKVSRPSQEQVTSRTRLQGREPSTPVVTSPRP